MLTSSHVPEYLVAAFAKRFAEKTSQFNENSRFYEFLFAYMLARISLRAPANAILATLPFIANLLIRHK